MENLLEVVENILITNEKYVSEDNKLLKAKVYEDVMNTDKKLLSLLMSNEKIKKFFFEKVENILVFDKQKFAWFIESKEFLPNSYTKYTNKIGLTKDGKFISQTNDVVLDFPYKDCVLQGGQDKDEQKRKEIFYHETIANEQISRMLAPKLFTNAKRYTKDGVEKNIEFNENDNLIIKGNNLIALASLLKRYENKVKCIYIDPPYNTGNDSFNYNDSFNHSTWLTFMKNRLELAKKLLTDDGSIWISIDDDEGHYLKVLCDEIFGRINFINTVIWEKKYSPQNDAKWLSDNHDFIHVYAKNKEIWRPNLLKRSKEMNDRYKNPDNDPRGDWKSSDLSVKTYCQEYDYPITTPSGRIVELPEGRCWMTNKENMQNLINDNRIWFGKNGDNVPSLKRFLSEVKQGMTSLTIWKYQEVGHNQDAKKEVRILNPKNVFSTPKPEKLIERIVELATKENDLVLDFHLGSGTTAAVAHKMNRRYIGIEQMDYIEDIAVERMKKVIVGEQGGISKAVNWNGGGTFVYCELLENAKTLIDEIEESTEKNINEIKEKIYKDERIAPYIFRKELEKVDDEFQKLNLDKKKKALCYLIDKNKLYVNYSDIDDENYNISEQDKKFTKSFYEDEVK